MSSDVCITRLRKELREIQKKPVENIRALPKETNILQWHYVLEGPKGSPYEGGLYHGIVTFPAAYPYKPPSIQMLTPNGRFKPATRLCLSMSDFHPESWNPMWSVGTILMGLYSFMQEPTPTFGSIETTDSFKRKAAKESLGFNCNNKDFCELFPELKDIYDLQHQKELAHRSCSSDADSANNLNRGTTLIAGTSNKSKSSVTTIVAILVALLACGYAIYSLAI